MTTRSEFDGHTKKLEDKDKLSDQDYIALGKWAFNNRMRLQTGLIQYDRSVGNTK